MPFLICFVLDLMSLQLSEKKILVIVRKENELGINFYGGLLYIALMDNYRFYAHSSQK